MQIGELAERTGVPRKTIRYYESIDLLPRPAREENQYRNYIENDVERLRFVAGARRLDFSLAEVREVLDLRDHGVAPCLTLLEALENKRGFIRKRIEELQELDAQIAELHRLGLTFPTDDVQGKACVCHLVKEQA